MKVLEALSRGKAIVSTSVGVQGLGEHGERAVIVADDAELFARVTAQLLLGADARRELQRRALALAEALPTWDDAAASLRDCYSLLLRRASLPEAEGAELR